MIPLGVLSILIGVYLHYFPKGLIPHQSDGMHHNSYTIKESKVLGVFVEELDYEIRPDTFKLKHIPKFYIEKTHIFDLDSPNNIKIQCVENNYCLQICSEPVSSFFKNRVGTEGFPYLNSSKDTLATNLKLISYDGEKLNSKVVGELRVFKK